MNSEAERLLAARQAEVEALGGLDAYRLRALQNLRLKTVVKASWGWAAADGTVVCGLKAQELKLLS